MGFGDSIGGTADILSRVLDRAEAAHLATYMRDKGVTVDLDHKNYCLVFECRTHDGRAFATRYTIGSAAQCRDASQMIRAAVVQCRRGATEAAIVKPGSKPPRPNRRMPPGPRPPWVPWDVAVEAARRERKSKALAAAYASTVSESIDVDTPRRAKEMLQRDASPKAGKGLYKGFWDGSATPAWEEMYDGVWDVPETPQESKPNAHDVLRKYQKEFMDRATRIVADEGSGTDFSAIEKYTLDSMAGAEPTSIVDKLEHRTAAWLKPAREKLQKLNPAWGT